MVASRRAAAPTFVKLGGSLITDKAQAYTPRTEVIERLAGEVRAALDADLGLSVLLGHGSGSFGHWAAKPFGTQAGVSTFREWRGYAEVAAAAARLNRLVTDIFLEAGVPIISLQPSASALCRDGALTQLSVRPIREALTNGLIPLVYGDVALDEIRGGTIASTEDLFFYLAGVLRPARILLFSWVDGVLDHRDRVIPAITPATHARWRDALSGSSEVDVTGGMLDKVARMVELVRAHPETEVRILTGKQPDGLTRALLKPDLEAGTLIHA